MLSKGPLPHCAVSLHFTGVKLKTHLHQVLCQVLLKPEAPRPGPCPNTAQSIGRNSHGNKLGEETHSSGKA